MRHKLRGPYNLDGVNKQHRDALLEQSGRASLLQIAVTNRPQKGQT